MNNIMMKMLRMLTMMAAIYAASDKYVISQTRSYEIKELKVGDQCPNFTFDKIIGASRSFAELSDFKRKLLIIDFWATWCGPCVDAMPRLDSLEKRYSDKMMVLPVTREPVNVVVEFMNKNKILKPLNIKSVAEDKELFKFFRHTGIPHEVWIDSTGKIIAITTADEVNEENIDKYFGGKQLNIKTKSDILGFDFDKPFFFGGFPNTSGIVGDSKLISTSTLMESIEGLPGSESLSPQRIGNRIMIKCTNATISGLYSTALGSTVKDWSKFDYLLRMRSRLIWDAKKVPQQFFTYEIVLPREDSLEINSYMLADLNRYFGGNFRIEGIIEKRLVKCWVLKRINEKDQMKTKGAPPSNGITGQTGYIRMTNRTIDQFLYVLSLEVDDVIPFVNETNYNGCVDFTLDVRPRDFYAVKDAIRKYGLQFVLEERQLDMIVIKDKP